MNLEVEEIDEQLFVNLSGISVPAGKEIPVFNGPALIGTIEFFGVGSSHRLALNQGSLAASWRDYTLEPTLENGELVGVTVKERS